MHKSIRTYTETKLFTGLQLFTQSKLYFRLCDEVRIVCSFLSSGDAFTRLECFIVSQATKDNVAKIATAIASAGK